jgi:hypothetical protein
MKEKLLAALMCGPIRAIGGVVFDSCHKPLMNTTELCDTIRIHRLPVNRIDAGGSPTWEIDPQWVALNNPEPRGETTNTDAD